MQISLCKRVLKKEQSSWNISKYYIGLVGQDSTVSIATPYGLDDLGIESLWGWDFPHPSRLALGPIQLLLSFMRVKQLGHGVVHSLPSSARLKKEYSYTSTPPLGHVACSRVNFTSSLYWNSEMKLCLSNMTVFLTFLRTNPGGRACL